MESLDVPEVALLPEQGSEEDIISVADMLLTALLSHAPGLLHAEYHPSRQETTWFIRPIRDGVEQPDKAISISKSCSYFRAVLARFGHHYMDGQLYHGHTMRFLRQKETMYRCLFYTSNMGQAGFWIRVFAEKEESDK